MEQSRKSSALFTRFVFAVSGVIALSYLALSALQASRAFHSGSQNVSSFVSNPYLITGDQTGNRNSVVAIQTQLEFMVWEPERRQLYEQLVSVVRQQINAQPFNGDLWRQLSFAAMEMENSAPGHAFALHNALLFTKWHPKERLVLLQQCVVRFETIEAVYPELCRNALRHLPKSIRRSVSASIMGVNLARLNYVLELSGISSESRK